MAVLVVLQALVDVFMSPAEHAIDQDGQLVGHGGDRFRRAEFVSEATKLGTEITLAAKQGGGGNSQGGCRAIDHPSSASADHLPAGDPVIWRQAQPRGKVMLILPAGHIEADLADDGLRDAHVDAVDAREVDAGDPVQLSPQVKLWRVTACLPAAFDACRRVSVSVGCG